MNKEEYKLKILNLLKKKDINFVRILETGIRFLDPNESKYTLHRIYYNREFNLMIDFKKLLDNLLEPEYEVEFSDTTMEQEERFNIKSLVLSPGYSQEFYFEDIEIVGDVLRFEIKKTILSLDNDYNFTQSLPLGDLCIEFNYATGEAESHLVADLATTRWKKLRMSEHFFQDFVCNALFSKKVMNQLALIEKQEGKQSKRYRTLHSFSRYCNKSITDGVKSKMMILVEMMCGDYFED